MTLEELKVLITAETSGLRRGLNDVRSQLRSANGNVGSSTSAMSSAFKKMAGVVAIAFSAKQIIAFGKQCVQTSSEIENAWIGLNSVLNGQGRNFDVAKGFIQDYVSDGLVPLQNAVTAYKNLSLRGYNDEQIQNTMNRLKDSASFARQSSYTLGEAVVTATEGLKNENSILVDNAGVTKNVAKMWEDYAKSIGTTRDKLTQQQKITAEVNGIMQETKFQVGDSAKYANTFSGQVSKLKANLTTMANEIGNVIKPILSAFIPVINGAINVITEFARKIEGLMNAAGIQTNVLSSLKSIAGASSNVSSNMDNVTESTKKAKNMLMGFDEINKLTKDDEDKDSTENNSNNAKNDLENANQEGYKLSDTMQSIINKAKELASEFKTGFSEGLGDDFNASLERTKEHLSNIGANLKDIFTDSDVQAAASNLANKIAYNFGREVGALVSIGQSVLECLVGGFDKYLEEYKGKIKGWLVRMFNIRGETEDLWGDFSVAVADIFEVLRTDTAKQIVANITGGLSDVVMGASELFMKIGRDILNFITKPIVDNKDKIKEALENTLKPIETLSGTVKQYLSDTWSKINEVYDNTVKPAFDKFTSGVSDTFSKAIDAYNTYIAPIIDSLANDIKAVYEEHIKPVIDNVVELVGEFINCMVDWYLNSLKPCIDFIYTSIIPAIAPVISYIKDVVMLVITNIIDVIGGIIRSLKGIIQFLDGVFTGDWNKAWEGIKNTFGGIWDAIKAIPVNSFNFVKDKILSFGEWAGNTFASIRNSIVGTFKDIGSSIGNFVSSGFKYIVNGAIYKVQDFINSFIAQINGALSVINSIPGVNIGTIGSIEIPKLAQGGYVSANTPQLAMIGDNTHEGEIVAPESKIAEAVSKGIATALQSLQNITNNNSPTELVIKIGEETIGRLAVNGINSLTKMNGASGLII